MNALSVSRTTNLIAIRQAEGREVITYEDLADALGVTVGNLRRHFTGHQEQWTKGVTELHHPSSETWTVRLSTAGGEQTIRVFSFRGAARFCRYTKSDRADALFDHLLDLFEQERLGAAAPTAPILSEMDKAGLMFQQTAQQLAAIGVAVHETRLLAETATAKVGEIEAKVDALAEAVEPEKMAATVKAEVEDQFLLMEARERTVASMVASLAGLTDDLVEALTAHHRNAPGTAWKDARSAAYRRFNKIAKLAAGVPRGSIRQVSQAQAAINAIRDQFLNYGITPRPAVEVVDLATQQRLRGLT